MNLKPVKKGQTGPDHPSTTHGAHAEVLPARISEKARAVAAEIAEAVPVRDGDGQVPVHDREAVRQLAATLCHLDDLSAYLEREGFLHTTGRKAGQPRSAAMWQRRMKSQAAREMAALGMTPYSRSKLGLNLAKTVDLATAMSHPDPKRRTALMKQAGLDVPEAGDDTT